MFYRPPIAAKGIVFCCPDWSFVLRFVTLTGVYVILTPMNVVNAPVQEFQKDLREHREEEEERLMDYLSKKYQYPAIRITDVQVNPDALQLVKEVDAREGKMAVYKRLKGVLTVAVNEPNNEKLAEILRGLEEKGYSHTITLASTKTLKQIWMYYKDIITTSATAPGTLSITNEELEEKIQSIQSVEAVREVLRELKKMSRAHRVSKNIEYVVATAVAVNASDIHIEPAQEGGVIRYRIDGVLTDMTELNELEYKQMVTRMKLVSGMKITAKGAQDGGFVVHLPKRTLSMRSSVIPEDEGGSFVVRLLDPRNVLHSIERLGIHPVVLEVFMKHIKRPNGMILNTGPTGSGKTTTLYSFLNEVKGEHIKTVTLEDPIEYRLEGIVQTEIDKDYSFASGLRAILRQDPDVILVGEVRDAEVAQVAVQAALTGHLVFSTLHTNDALGALPRLLQFEVDPQAFSRAINIVIAQRLVRQLCPVCSEQHPLTDEQKEKIQQMIAQFPERYKEEFDLNAIKRPSEASPQCQECNDGYKKRIGVFEVFEVNDEIERVIREESGVAALRTEVRKQGLPFMEDDALWKVLKGVTSLEEIERVIGVVI